MQHAEAGAGAMSVALFWGVGLAALGWLAFEIAEFM
jgi:hypothetical protein